MRHYSTTDQRIHTLITWARSSSSGSRQLELLATIIEIAPEMTDTDGERARLLCRIARMLHELRGVEVPQDLIVRAMEAARTSVHAEPRAEASARLARMIRDREECNAAQAALLAEIRTARPAHPRANAPRRATLLPAIPAHRAIRRGNRRDDPRPATRLGHAPPPALIWSSTRWYNRLNPTSNPPSARAFTPCGNQAWLCMSDT